MKQTTIRQWRRAALLLLLTVMTTATATATDTDDDKYITDVMVIGGSKTETDKLKDAYGKQGWTLINQDLNAGCGSGSDYIYLLYKEKSDANASVGDFITGFIISTATGTIPDNLTYNNCVYKLVPFDGSDYFKSNKGDLNSHCGSGSATIHLYFSKEYRFAGEDYSTVRSISFDNTQSGAVTTTNGSTGYDLNTGCGSGSDYIYMHADKAPGWEITKYNADTKCVIEGFDGPKRIFTNIVIPTVIDSATVMDFWGMSFSGFTNLETMRFATSSSIARMPSMQGCSKFKNVQTGTVACTTPPSMTSILNNAFAGTAVSEITLTAVTDVGANAFSGCDSLSSVTFKTSPVGITNDAFSNISSTCTINYPGSMDDWFPSMYMYSPNLVVKGPNDSWRCGWCGGANAASGNYLYWTLNTAGHLSIDWLREGTLNKQVINTRNWNKDNVKTLTLNHVDSIGYEAFEGCKNLTSVTIGNDVSSIGKWAFNYCTGLTSVHISDLAAWCSISFGNDFANPLRYAHHLYLNDSEIKNLVIPNSVDSIRNYAFYGCSGLTKVTIPNSVKSIGSSAFTNCTNLTSVHISDLAAWCNISFGNDFANPLRYAHHLYLNDTEIEDLVIPNSITSIKDYVFHGCSYLTTVTIPNSVTSIGSCAFFGCSGLTTVTIPNSVTSIEKDTFHDCESLTSITIPNSVTIIKDGAFNSCKGLTSVTIPNSVTSIGGYAFYGCSGLTSVTISNRVTSIGDLAFNYCESLKDLYFDGTEAQWNHVTKGNNWNDHVASGFTEHWRCTVTFDANGHGTAPDPQTNLWSRKSKVTEPAAPTAPGYAFTGWYTNAACTTLWNFRSTVAHDMTLYAGWKVLKGDANGDGQVTIADALAVVNYILGQSSGTFVIQAADVNNDNHITIADAVGIVNIIL